MKNSIKFLSVSLALLTCQVANANLLLDKEWLAEQTVAQVQEAVAGLDLPLTKPVIEEVKSVLTLTREDNNADLIVKAVSKQELLSKAD